MRDKRDSNRPGLRSTPGGKAEKRREQFAASRGLDLDSAKAGAAKLATGTRPKKKPTPKAKPSR